MMEIKSNIMIVLRRRRYRIPRPAAPPVCQLADCHLPSLLFDPDCATRGSSLDCQ